MRNMLLRWFGRMPSSGTLTRHRIGVIGFSAGGHLAALASNADFRPDFALLIYPAYLTAESDLTVTGA